MSTQDRLMQIEWLLNGDVEEEIPYLPPYGDVTALNRCRLIMDCVGKETLGKIAGAAIDLLDTSVSVYEVNGDYAFGIFSSGWCRFMDTASRALCQTDDNREALSCGKWLCHESCWNNSAKRAIDSGCSTDIECVGGIHLYAEPIYAGDQIVGAINIGYGDPPESTGKLGQLEALFGVDAERLRQISRSYKSRPEVMVNLAKKMLRSWAILIGDIVDKVDVQKRLLASQQREKHLNRVQNAIRKVHRLMDRGNNTRDLIDGACLNLTENLGYYKAWIALFDASFSSVTMTASAGFNGSFEVMKELLLLGEFSACMRRAMEEKRIQIVQRPGSECPDCPLSSQYADRSGFTLPLSYGDRIYGIISVSVPALFSSDTDEQELFKDIAQDISFALGKIEMERSLRESELKFRGIYENMSIGVAQISLEFTIRHANRAYCQMLGYSEEELVGRHLREITHPEIVEENLRLQTELAHGRVEHYQMEKSFKHRDGRTVHGILNANLIRDASGKPLYFLGSVLDITERKVAEKEREKLQAQLNQAQKMESIGRLAGGVAHDLNNMLGVIIGNTELAMDSIDSQPIHDDLKEIMKAAERSANLTRQLLAFARRQNISPRVVDLNSSVEGMLKMLRRLLGEDIELTWQPGEGLWPIKIDPSQIDQILANLCANCRDAISSVGKVTIKTDNVIFDQVNFPHLLEPVTGEYLLLSVSDSGCGMEKQTLENIFEPFFTTKEVGKGTGLGLSMVYGIVKQNNGFINVRSEPGKGTEFSIYLPVYIGKKELGQKESLADQKKSPLESETILLVEDEPSILKLTRIMLERQGYKVLAANSPVEAIDMAHKHNGMIHLLMTDIVMPAMNGRDLAKNISSIYPDIKRLFMSGYTADVIASHGVLNRGVHFIQKPFSKQELVSKVKEALADMP